MVEIKSQDWSALCERLNQHEQGGTVTIHKLEVNGVETEVTRDAAFDRIDFGKRDGCNDHFIVRCSGERATIHEIVEPIHVQMSESKNGAAFSSLSIKAEDGVTRLEFHPGIQTAWLEGLAVS